MNSFARDIAYACRTLLRRPLFTGIAIASLALGIAVNATVFSWVERVLLQPMPGVWDLGRIVSIKTVAPNGDLLDSSLLDAQDFAKESKSLAGIIAFSQEPLYMGDLANGRRVWSQLVSGNFFDVLGVKRIRGRTFSAEEQKEQPGGPNVAVISETLWRSEFHSDPGIVGRQIELNRHSFTVIGIVPAAFKGAMNGLQFDLWVPVSTVAELTGSEYWPADRNARPLALMARLKPGATLQEAQTEIRLIAARLATSYPDTNRNLDAAVMPLADSPDGVQRIFGKLLRVLFVIAGAVLLIVCANVGNLLLVRATARTKEFGIRASLGASPGRLIQQLFAEALVLAAAGTGMGLIASTWLVQALLLFTPVTELPTAKPAGGLPVLGILFTCALGVLAAVLCGLAPAIQLSRRGVHDALREGGRSSSPGKRPTVLRGALVVCELSLTLLALIGSGLFIRSFQNARAAYPGFEPAGVLIAGVDLSQVPLPPAGRLAMFRRLRTQLAAIPGATAASLSDNVPLALSGGAWEEISVNGYTPSPGENMKLWRNIVSPGYFATLRIPFLAGRDFTDRDTLTSQPVAIVNETFVRRYFAGQGAVGRKFRLWDKDFTIAGVVRDSKYLQLNEPSRPYFYLSLGQFHRPGDGIAIELRTAGDPARFARLIRSTVRSVDPNALVYITMPFVHFMSAAYSAQKVGAAVLTLLGAVSLLLAVLGLYGVMAFSIVQRTNEIGIRMALGARPAQVLRLVMTEGLWLCLAGIAIGLVMSVIFSRLAAGALYGVGHNHWVIYLSAASILSFFALLASWLPARRAARIEPMRALHWE